MTIDNSCLDCYYPYIFDYSLSECNLIQIAWDTVVDRTRQSENIYSIEIVFSDNVSLVLDNYDVKFYIDGELITANSSQIFTVNNTIQY